MQFYFAYGSNLDYDDWSLWCSRKNANPEGLVEYKRAFLPGFTVKYSHYSSGREGGAANLYPVTNNLVGTYGALFQIDENCLELLDSKEGHPSHYQRINVEVLDDDGKSLDAITYISKKYDSNDFFLPTEKYHNLIHNGMQRRNMPVNDIELAKQNLDNSDCGFIIAYGTLKKGMEREQIMPGEFVSNGKIKGDLYDLGPFPGLLDGDGEVMCEIYYSRNMESDIGFLDQIEGTNLIPPLYERRLIPVECDDGKLRFGICYFYCGDVAGYALISNGIWSE
ncbi:MAG TPA: hypothetical protein HA359_03840 [Candidatus Poseidoniaceae archaeon]|nr:MAG TPA: hypothetical protein D7H84_03845 [Candidatus Poseidoniales archaeon]HII23369.1 hypothetical protein [Candidatus Poseidoniaceae archaeon]|tara:strand:+ start:50 stop:889 length:840 start_codon:yes stop_codon:yes gene_type:complete